MPTKPEFVKSAACLSMAHCITCRDKKERSWRESLKKGFSLPGDCADFDCPYGLPWGYYGSSGSAEKAQSKIMRLIEGARNYIRAEWGSAQSQVPNDVAEWRLGICRLCDEVVPCIRSTRLCCGPLLKLGRRTCGCVLESKVKLPDQKCPIGKWPKWSDDAKGQTA
jgi:hypothetical protein